MCYNSFVDPALIFRAPPAMPSRRVVLLSPSVPIHPRQLPSCQQSASINPLDATLAGSLASAANKRLTKYLSPVDATLTKNQGEGTSISQSSNLPTFQPSNDPRPNSFTLTFLATPHNLTPYPTISYKNHRGRGRFTLSLSHQISLPALFSTTYKLPVFYPLCFHIHPCNGGVVGGAL